MTLINALKTSEISTWNQVTSKPISSIAGYSPETSGGKQSSKRPFPSGLAWSRGDGSAWVSTDLADHLHLGCLPHKGWSLSLESRKPSRKMERAWEESMSALSRAQQHQKPLNVPAPTRDGFHAFCSEADMHCA